MKQSIRNWRVGTFIVSFPKTGRTWLRAMVGRALIDRYGLPEPMLLDTFHATRRAGLPGAMFSHGGPYHLLDDRPYDRMVADTHEFAGKRVVYLIRDVRDTLVSFYFQQSKREGMFAGDIHSFTRDARFGIRKIVAFYTLWFRHQHVPREFKLIRYEEMRASPVSILTDVLEFIGVDGDVSAVAQRAVEFASFDNMKAMEAKGTIDGKVLQPGDPKDAESFKVRKGRIGGFVEYLNDDDLQFIDDAIADIGDPSCDWYLAASPVAPSDSTLSKLG